MRNKLLISVALILFTDVSCLALGISSKLDFGSDSSPKIIGTVSQYRSKLNQEPKSDFDDLGVICVSGGCNTTKSESTDTIQADVVVHVKTSIDVNKNKSKFVDDTPDVPVVIGTAGTSFDQSQSRSFDERPLVLTNIDDMFPSPSPRLPPLFNSFASVSSPGIQYIQPEPQVDIKIKTLPPVTFAMRSDGKSFKDIRYNTNGLGLHVPYFEPSFHNHYFGENPPPQMIWYPKRSGFVDSIDYKPKAMWKPSFWDNNQQHRHQMASEDCPCKNQAPTGLQWHTNRRVQVEDPGAHIDDKLAPLN